MENHLNTRAIFSMLACIFLYGIQFVPAKKNETYNGTVFHWFMCSGSLFTGLLLGVVLEGKFPEGTLEGLLGGALVAISNILVLHVKQSLGLFSGVVIYQAANLVTGYCVGRFGLFEAQVDAGHIPWLRDLGICAFLVSLGLALLANPHARALSLSAPSALSQEVEEVNMHMGSFVAEECDSDLQMTTGQRGIEPQLRALPVSVELSPTPGDRQPRERRKPCKRRLVGGLLAVLAGVFRGVSPLPFYEWRQANPTMQYGVFVFPQALGVWMAGTFIYLTYASGKKVLNLPSPHHPHIRPAFLSGCLWSGGFVGFATALGEIGFTAAYALSVIGSVFISQIMSVVVFKEIRDHRHLRLFYLCCFVQALGMALIVAGT